MARKKHRNVTLDNGQVWGFVCEKRSDGMHDGVETDKLEVRIYDPKRNFVRVGARWMPGCMTSVTPGRIVDYIKENLLNEDDTSKIEGFKDSNREMAHHIWD